MPEINFTIYCDTCGSDLDPLITMDIYNDIKIKVCENCIEEKNDEIESLENDIEEKDGIIEILKDDIKKLNNGN